MIPDAIIYLNPAESVRIFLLRRTSPAVAIETISMKTNRLKRSLVRIIPLSPIMKTRYITIE